MRKGLLLASMFFSSLALVPVALADTLNFTLTQPSQTATPGSLLSFSATISAPSTNGANVYLNGDSINVSTGLTIDDSDFANTPFFFAPGQTYTDTLFTVAGDVAGMGTISLLGGADANTYDTLATQTFAVQAAAAVTPEPSSLWLFATGAAGLCALSLRRRTA